MNTNVRKLKIYLDTSVISYLFADEVPEKKAETQKLWQDIISNKYDVYLSDTTLFEIMKCSQPKRDAMIAELEKIKYTHLEINDEVQFLTNEYINNGVLSPNSKDDCSHIAFAVSARCNVIVSWNFKHLVNYKTNSNVKIVNAIINYGEISIISPTMLNESEEV